MAEATTEQNGARFGAASAGEKKTRWGAYTPKELKMMGPPEWLIPGIFPAEGTGVVWGDKSTLKTFLCLSVGAAVATGMDWHGNPVEKPGAVLYVATEGQRGMGPRIAAWEQEFGLSLDGAPLYVISEPVDLLKEADEFAAMVRVRYPDVRYIIFDTLSKSTRSGKDEIDNKEMAKAAAGAETIARALHCFVLIVHHSTKAGNTSRGGSSLEDDVDTVFRLTRDRDTGTVTVTCTKQRDGEDNWSFTLRARKVDLGEQYPDGSLVLVGASEKSSTRAEQPRRSKDAPARRAASKRVTQADVYAAVGKAGKPVSPADIRKEVGGSRQTIQNHLKRLCEDGWLLKVGGKYSLAPTKNVYAA